MGAKTSALVCCAALMLVWLGGTAHPALWIGTLVFGMFLDRYDVFHLSRAPNVRLPGGRPVFPEVPALAPEDVLASHGLKPGVRQLLDPAIGVTLTSWLR